MSSRLAAVAVVALGLFAAAPASANPGNCSLEQPPAPSPRIVHATLHGLDFNVLLPSDYASSGRSYPVLYLLHGTDYNENSWLRLTDLEQFTAGFSGSQAAIVVMPDGGPLGFYTDWYQGDEQWETYHLRRLLPYIESHFRTIADRAHRAVAGFSMGGLGAVGYAARHPDLFAAAGSFSGLDHLTLPDDAYTGAPPAGGRTDAGSPGPAYGGHPLRPYRPPDDNGSGCGQQNGSATGDPVSDRVMWHGRNPTDLASNLRGVAVYIAAGNGAPCDAADTAQPPAIGAPLEPAIRQMNEKFDSALTAAGITHTTNLRNCGLHTMRYAEGDLRAFWSRMVAAFGSRPPAEFSFRAVDPDFSVWGWNFHADRNRALEFLEVRSAGRRGLILTGSGTETVVTAPLFKARHRVAVKGALPAFATADRSGRVTIRVDLGAAHTQKQFAPGAATSTFVTRVVRLRGPPIAQKQKCLDLGGKIAGKHVGPVVLGRKRARVRSALGSKGNRHTRRGLDRWCVRGGGILEAGYPIKRLSRAVRKRLRGKAVLALVSSRRFTLAGLRPGASVRTTRRRLHGERRYRIGRNVWFLAHAARATLVVRTRGGRVRAVGLAASSATRSRRDSRRLLGAWKL